MPNFEKCLCKQYQGSCGMEAACAAADTSLAALAVSRTERFCWFVIVGFKNRQEAKKVLGNYELVDWDRWWTNRDHQVTIYRVLVSNCRFEAVKLAQAMLGRCKLFTYRQGRAIPVGWRDGYGEGIL